MTGAYVTWMGAVQLLAAATVFNLYAIDAQMDITRKSVQHVTNDVARLQRDVDKIGRDVAEILRTRKR